MRKYLAFTAAIVLILLLCGCTAAPEETTPSQPSAAPVTEAPTEEATEVPTEPATAVPTEAETEAATEEETKPTALPYLQKVSFADQSIFDGPGYDYFYVGTVKEAGTYTIVEEAWDPEDHLWGRLKSGAGWIDLTEVQQRLESPEPISANYADDLLLDSGNYHRYVGCTEEYAVCVAFRAQETLTDVRLYSMTFHETMELDEELFFLSRLEPGKPLVADLDFPGDMSTFAILFRDSAGIDRYFTVYISGRNGTLVLSEQVG